ncbi:MAG: glycyl-radical enzyme activating protein [Gracilibacteraceae bacterium]|nr:glycyl-radical enzyme activating protein [Gracilibacteraceae bacterium]
MTGIIFNIQRFSLHDGTGIRTVVFLKGCPLRCEWCANPESQLSEPETAWSAAKCIGCGHCLTGGGAVKWEGGRVVPLRRLSGAEAERLCPARALQVFGEERSVADIIDIVERDMIFYENSEGGLTLSGGEPLTQPAFTAALLREAQGRHIHTAMETGGLADYQALRSAARHLDQLIYDVKIFESRLHQERTGAGNRVILENFRRLMDEFPRLPTLARTPVIPGVNDNEKEISDIASFIRPYPNVSYELLPYHRLGEPKYEALGRVYPMGKAALDAGRFKQLQIFAERRMAR